MGELGADSGNTCRHSHDFNIGYVLTCPYCGTTQDGVGDEVDCQHTWEYRGGMLAVCPYCSEKQYVFEVPTGGVDTGVLRTFETGATRDTVEGKLDYEGALSPIVLKRFAEYMDKHCTASDGSRRSTDNWQLGIPKEQYLKSLIRHTLDLWLMHRGYPVSGIFIGVEDLLCAIMFNAMGLLHEQLVR